MAMNVLLFNKHIKLRALFIAIFFPILSFAQTAFGIKGGLNLSDIVMTNYINPDVESDLRIRSGLHAGFFANGAIDERIGIAGELLYSDKGVNANNTIHLHYITIPVLFQYRLTDVVSAELGPELGYMFSARSAIGDESGTYNNKFDLSLDGGFRFELTNFIVGLRYCVGVFSVREPFETMGPSGIEKVKYQNRVLQLSVGYRIWTFE